MEEFQNKKQETKKPLIKIANLSIIYNKGKSNEVRALENINLEIYPEEYVVILGPSGCGKSTLLYSISGLQRPTSGEIIFAEKLISSYTKKQIAEFHQKSIGMIFQSFYLIGTLTVSDNVCLPKVFEKDAQDDGKEKARSLLERFSISDQAEKFPNSLSGGQKQRVSIARSLINNPPVILADEPVGNLDSKSAFNVMSILNELNVKDKKTVVLVTHDPLHVQYADRVVHMKDGKIIKVEIMEKSVKKDEEKLAAESFIFEDGKLKRKLIEGGMVREEIISDDVRLLMRAFKNLSMSQIGAMLVPFKAQQLFSYVFFSVPDEQMDVAKKNLQNYLSGGIDVERLRNELDLDYEKGGAGWDKRYVETFIERSSKIIEQSKKIDFSNIPKSASDIAEYLNELFKLDLSKTVFEKLSSLLSDRMKNRIGIEEFEHIADMPALEGGLGFDKRTAKKIAREIEIILLMRYSS